MCPQPVRTSTSVIACDRGAVAVDSVDGDLSDTVVACWDGKASSKGGAVFSTNGLAACALNKDNWGTFSITFSVTNSAGLSASVTRSLQVQKACLPGSDPCPDGSCAGDTGACLNADGSVNVNNIINLDSTSTTTTTSTSSTSTSTGIPVVNIAPIITARAVPGAGSSVNVVSVKQLQPYAPCITSTDTICEPGVDVSDAQDGNITSKELRLVGLANCDLNTTADVGTTFKITFVVYDNSNPPLKASFVRSIVIAPPCGLGLNLCPPGVCVEVRLIALFLSISGKQLTVCNTFVVFDNSNSPLKASFVCSVVIAPSCGLGLNLSLPGACVEIDCISYANLRAKAGGVVLQPGPPIINFLFNASAAAQEGRRLLLQRQHDHSEEQLGAGHRQLLQTNSDTELLSLLTLFGFKPDALLTMCASSSDTNCGISAQDYLGNDLTSQVKLQDVSSCPVGAYCYLCTPDSLAKEQCQPGDYIFRFTVTDQAGRSRAAYVSIAVEIRTEYDAPQRPHPAGSRFTVTDQAGRSRAANVSIAVEIRTEYNAKFTVLMDCGLGAEALSNKVFKDQQSLFRNVSSLYLPQIGANLDYVREPVLNSLRVQSPVTFPTGTDNPLLAWNHGHLNPDEAGTTTCGSFTPRFDIVSASVIGC
eukprot:gene3741-13800_t